MLSELEESLARDVGVDAAVEVEHTGRYLKRIIVVIFLFVLKLLFFKKIILRFFERVFLKVFVFIK